MDRYIPVKKPCLTDTSYQRDILKLRLLSEALLRILLAKPILELFKPIKRETFPTKDYFVLMLSTKNCCLYAVFNYWTVGINYYDIWLVQSVRFTEFTV